MLCRGRYQGHCACTVVRVLCKGPFVPDDPVEPFIVKAMLWKGSGHVRTRPMARNAGKQGDEDDDEGLRSSGTLVHGVRICILAQLIPVLRIRRSRCLRRMHTAKMRSQ